MTAARFVIKTKGGYDFFENASALQKEIRRGNERDAFYWAYQFIPKYENYLWRRLKVIANEDIGIASPQVLIAVKSLSDMYFEMREKDGTSCFLTLANAVMLMCRADKCRLADHLQISVVQGVEQHKLRLEIPDYALDRHTQRGRAMGRGFEHFKTIGTQLSTSIEIGDPYKETAFSLLANKIKVRLAGTKKADEAKMNSAQEGTLFTEEEAPE